MDRQLTTPSSALKNQRGRKTPTVVKKPPTTAKKTPAIPTPKSKHVRLKKTLLVSPTFAFYPSQAFDKSTMLRITDEKEDMMWDFDLGKYVEEELLAKHPGNVYIHGYRCEEFQLLPGISLGTAIPYFVATCMPPGAYT